VVGETRVGFLLHVERDKRMRRKERSFSGCLGFFRVGDFVLKKTKTRRKKEERTAATNRKIMRMVS